MADARGVPLSDPLGVTERVIDVNVGLRCHRSVPLSKHGVTTNIGP